MTLKTAWIEKRQYERQEASWDVVYQMIAPEEAKTLCEKPNYHRLAAEGENPASWWGLTRDISKGGFCITGSQALDAGSNVILYLHSSQAKSSLVVVAEVVRSQSEKGQYQTGLKILAVDQDSLDRMIESALDNCL